MIFKKGILSLFAVTILLTLVGCDESEYSPRNDLEVVSTKEDISESLESLSNAKKIVLTKELFSLNNAYNVVIDDIDFGSITGKYVNMTGDKFKLKDNSGNELSSEKQIKRWGMKLDRLAEVYDYSGNVVGYIGEEVIEDMFKMGYIFHFYDKDKNEIGILKKEVFSFLDTFKVYDLNDNLCYEINAELTLIASKYTITVHDNSTIPTDQAMYLTAILNAIKEASSKEE